MQDAWIVVTSVQRPTAAVEAIAERCRSGLSVVVVADKKTPPDWHCDGVVFLDVPTQRKVFPRLADLLPYDHYCRKNLGYLYAMRQGADCILETDDDNLPYETFGRGLSRQVRGRRVTANGWVNVYRHFTEARPIWPRGLPLDAIHEAGTVQEMDAPAACPLQQYLADEDPDVDAVYRLLLAEPVFFNRQAEPVVLGEGTWCPMNSQNTAWFREAFALLYLPCHVSFRMTDIWRSFVAQAALARGGLSIAFHPPTVRQVRNPHDLMRDFADEVVGYLSNRRILNVLKAAPCPSSRPDRLGAVARSMWLALVDAGILQPQERAILEAWFEHVQEVLP